MSSKKRYREDDNTFMFGDPYECAPTPAEELDGIHWSCRKKEFLEAFAGKELTDDFKKYSAKNVEELITMQERRPNAENVSEMDAAYTKDMLQQACNITVTADDHPEIQRRHVRMLRYHESLGCEFTWPTTDDDAVKLIRKLSHDAHHASIEMVESLSPNTERLLGRYAEIARRVSK
ncbi:MAG TPA: hypothetical protein PKM88_04070 [bacterium]|nr:hypothetical protein [bacterium]